MFPTATDLSFWRRRRPPSWADRLKAKAPFVNVDQVVNSHGGIKIPNFLVNTHYLFRLWQSNRRRMGESDNPKDFCLHILTYPAINQQERHRYCKRILRKLAKGD